MKQYPGEQEIVSQVVNAYRSAAKYMDIGGTLSYIFNTSESIEDKINQHKEVGDYQSAAKEWVKLLTIAHNH